MQAYHKLAEDAGDGAAIGTAISLTAVGRGTTVAAGLKDLVRLRITATSSVVQAGWLTFRVLGMVWFDTVKG